MAFITADVCPVECHGSRFVGCRSADRRFGPRGSSSDPADHADKRECRALPGGFDQDRRPSCIGRRRHAREQARPRGTTHAVARVRCDPPCCGLHPDGIVRGPIGETPELAAAQSVVERARSCLATGDLAVMPPRWVAIRTVEQAVERVLARIGGADSRKLRKKSPLAQLVYRWLDPARAGERRPLERAL